MLINRDFIKTINQKNNSIFTIEWIDGTILEYQLSHVQKNCPCARCVDESTGKRLVDITAIPADLEAKRIYSIGRYALKIEFASGCSRGIYPLSWLRQFPSL